MVLIRCDACCVQIATLLDSLHRWAMLQTIETVLKTSFVRTQHVAAFCARRKCIVTFRNYKLVSNVYRHLGLPVEADCWFPQVTKLPFPRLIGNASLRL